MTEPTEPTERHLLHQETGALAELKGELEEQLLFEGSKSEHTAPVLVIQNGDMVRVMVKGDNPFTHETLRLYLGQPVSIRGTWRRGVVVVETNDLSVLPPGDEEPSAGSELAEGLAEGADEENR